MPQLALSGTPFRSDARAIPFVRYDEERRCAPDFVYGYADAVADDVCRPLAFRLLDATLRWRVDAQETIAAFHGYYTKYKKTERVISDDAGKTAARLYLVWALARTLRNALEGILGVAAPERMDEAPGDDEAA